MNAGTHTIHVGDVSVTAIHDGDFLPGSLDLASGVTSSVAADTMARHHRRVPPVITVTAFLLRHAGRLTLVDTGSADKMGPGHGLLIGHLARLGVAPADIDTIVLTHVHSDHAGGMTGPDGAALFVNAEVAASATEIDFWLDDDRPLPEARRPSRTLAQSILGAYRDRLRPVAEASDAMPGLRHVPLPGHTPGHSGWMLTSGADSLLIWGDIVHMPGLQFARPDATVIYDLDPAMAEASRRRIFDLAATDRVHVAGQHLDFPTFGHVERRGEGFGFIADQWMASA